MRTKISAVIFLALAAATPAQAEQRAWLNIVERAASYELRGHHFSCPIHAARFDGKQLQVHYSCSGLNGQGEGFFRGQQSGSNSFTGQYRLHTPFKRLAGHMQLKFLSDKAVLLSAAGERMTLHLKAKR